MDRSRVGIVIPALNESASIGAVVTRAAAFGLPIVVDDGSTDGTGELARAAGAHVVTHTSNRGYDGALDSGFAAAAALGLEVVVTLDADSQHDPLAVPRFLAAIEAGADIVIGVRPRTQRLAEWLFAQWARLRFGIRDPLCGFKAYRMDLHRALGHFDSYRSIGTELMLHGARRGARIEQIPIAVRDRIDAPRFAGRLRGNLRIARAWLIAMAGRR